MAIAKVTARIDGDVVEQLSIGYEVVGDRGHTFVVSPGGRFGRESPGIRELGAELAALGNRVVLWDRPNCGESDVCFAGSSESAMQADVLAALLTHLDLVPAVVTGGSGGARVSLLTAARHRDVAAGLVMWWITGGVYGLMKVGTNYGGLSVEAAWNGGMEAVAALPEWSEVVGRNPGNKQRFLDVDPRTFIDTVERWMYVHVPRDGELTPGLPDAEARALDVPTLVLQNGASDPVHTRATSEALAGMLPNAQLADPPWPDTAAIDSEVGRRFVGWPALAPVLHAWAEHTLGGS